MLKTKIKMVLTIVGVWSALAYGLASDSQRTAPESRYPDWDTFVDANAVLMMVYNDGNIAYDNSAVFGRTDGFYFPYTGYPVYPGHMTAVYSAGIWIGGRVGGDLRVAVAEYSSEFTYGYMVDGGPVPDNASFRVYKLDESSGPGDPDWDEWPGWQGAPTDGSGNPLLLGDQTLWAVFNDADSNKHQVFETDPLGVEVQQTIWASDNAGEQVSIYILYKLYNKGNNPIDSFFVSFWADPDLGSLGDDLVGCDTVRDAFFCYNDGADPVYGPVPPAWGGKVISGLVVPSPGDTAVFAGNPLPDFRNLRPYAFAKYINGTDPQTAEEAFNYMRGFDRFGNVVINPITGLPTRFMVSGDPELGTGWLDEFSSDRRLMVTLGPISFEPGDSQQVAIELAIDVGNNPVNSVTVLKSTLDSGSSYYWEPMELFECDSVTLRIEDYGRLVDWYWEEYFADCWLYGYNWGGNTFYGGADNGSYFLGSNITDPELSHDVEIHFSSGAATQKGYRYVKGTLPSYYYGGYRDVPFTVWDVDESRQLNVAFVEEFGGECYNYTWGPCNDTDGGHEYLLILNSDYSAAENPVYTESLLDIIADGNFDNLYAIWPRLRWGHDLSELDDGQIIGFCPQKLNVNGIPDTIFLQPRQGESYTSQAVEVDIFTTQPCILLFTAAPANAFRIHRGIYAEQDTTERIYVGFRPPGPGSYEGELNVIDLATGELVEQVVLIGTVAGLHSAGLVLDPDTMFAVAAFTIAGIDELGLAYVGNFEDDYDAFQVQEASVTIDDYPIVEDITVGTHPDFSGPVLEVTFNVTELMQWLGPAWDISQRTLKVAGRFYDGDYFAAYGDYILVGHRVGDADGNGIVNVSDAVYLLGFIFAGGSAPLLTELGDVNCDDRINVSDIVYLVRYVFGRGEAPCER